MEGVRRAAAGLAFDERCFGTGSDGRGPAGGATERRGSGLADMLRASVLDPGTGTGRRGWAIFFFAQASRRRRHDSRRRRRHGRRRRRNSACCCGLWLRGRALVFERRQQTHNGNVQQHKHTRSSYRRLVGLAAPGATNVTAAQYCSERATEGLSALCKRVVTKGRLRGFSVLVAKSDEKVRGEKEAVAGPTTVQDDYGTYYLLGHAQLMHSSCTGLRAPKRGAIVLVGRPTA